jgi:hypothetical protein
MSYYTSGKDAGKKEEPAKKIEPKPTAGSEEDYEPKPRPRPAADPPRYTSSYTYGQPKGGSSYGGGCYKFSR